MKVKLGDYVLMVQEREVLKKVDTSKYVSTENILADRNGVKFPANTIPLSKTITTYKKDDILISNIRPYFKKIWKAEFDGPKSNDVIAFRTKDSRLLQDYLYVVLQSDNFFNYVANTAKGTKMPRGDKKAIINYEFELPNIQLQRKISHTILVLEKKIRLNNQINDNLIQISLLNLANMIKNKSYEIRKISDLDIIISDHVANGSFKALKENVTYYDENNYALFLRNIDFKNRLDGANRYIDKESYNYLKKSHLFGGEVVISNVADVGTIHRVPFINRPMVIGNNQIFIKSVHSFLTEYLYVYFKSYWGQNSIFSITSGSAQQKFNKTDFRALEIPIPSPNWILTNIRPFILAKDKIFNETKSLEQLKKNLLNNYF